MMITLLAQLAPSSTNPEAMIAAAVAAAQAQQAAFNASMVSLAVLGLMILVLIVMGLLTMKVDLLVQNLGLKPRGKANAEHKAPDEPKVEKE